MAEPDVCSVCWGTSEVKLYKITSWPLDHPKVLLCKYCAMCDGFEYIGKIKVGWLLSTIQEIVRDELRVVLEQLKQEESFNGPSS